MTIVLTLLTQLGYTQEIDPPQALLFVEGKADTGRTWNLVTYVTVYNLLDPGGGLSATAGGSIDLDPATTVSLSAGVGMHKDGIYPVGQLQTTTTIDPVIFWLFAEAAPTALDAIVMANLPVTERIAVGLEGEVLALPQTNETWAGMGPNLFLLPTKNFALGGSLLLSPEREVLHYTPRLYILLNL